MSCTFKKVIGLLLRKLFCYIAFHLSIVITFNFHLINCRILPSRLSTVNGSILIVMAFAANFKTIFSNCGFILRGIDIEDRSEPICWYCLFLLNSEMTEEKQDNSIKKELMIEQYTSRIRSAIISTLRCVA